MEHICVHVAIEGVSEVWGPVSERLQVQSDIRLVSGTHRDERVDVVFYDASDPSAAGLLAAPDPRRPFWTIGVDLVTRRVVELSGSQFALTSVDDLAGVIRASGFTLRTAGPSVRFETGD